MSTNTPSMDLNRPGGGSEVDLKDANPLGNPAWSSQGGSAGVTVDETTVAGYSPPPRPGACSGTTQDYSEHQMVSGLAPMVAPVEEMAGLTAEQTAAMKRRGY